MTNTSKLRVYGRSKLAHAYFPSLTEHSAWLKLKSLMLEDPDTASLATMSRRTFTIKEVATIFDSIGVP